MSLTNLAIKHRTTIVVLTLLIAAGGLWSYVSIPKESRPSIEIPNIVVTTLYPGASPDDVESLVTQEIEQEVESINGIDELSSTSTEGVSTIQVEFTPDVSMDKAYQDVRDKVDIARSDLPEDVEEPIVSEIDVSEFPIMTVNLSANYSLVRLKEVAEDLQDELEGISSVLEAPLVGGLTREVQVNVNLSALKGANLTFQDLINTIQQENTNLPGGDIDVDRQNYLVRVDGQFEDPERIENLVVKSTEGKNIYVRDVADVTFGFKERDSYARLKTLKKENEEGELVNLPPKKSEIKQVISLDIKKRSGDNVITTSEKVKETIEGFDLPSGTQVTITGDESENVESLVTDLENNIISGLIFVVMVLLFFMGVRNATLVGIAIPLSMFVSFLVFQAMGQTFNFIILFSLIIALGMLVDNAVVIVENIYRFKEQGYSRWEAARLATAEVAGPVIGATATTVLAFAPMLFWPGIIGEFMGFLPLTLIITLTSSLFVAIIINPVVTGFFVKVEDPTDDADEAFWQNWPRIARYGGAAAIVVLAVILAIASWETLLVLAVGIPLLYYLYTRVLKPIGDRFMQTGMPRLVQRYRTFLKNMLRRDYSGDRAMLYNTAALAAFTGGIVLAILGGLVTVATSRAAGMVLLAPGGLLAALGLIGLLFHTMEGIFRGGSSSVRGGLIFGAVMLVLLGLILITQPVPFDVIVVMLALPALVAGIGLVGLLHQRDSDSAGLIDSLLLLLAGFMVVGAVAGGVAGFFGEGPDPRVFALLAPAFVVGSVGYLGRRYRQKDGALFMTDNRARLLVSSIGALVAIIALFAAAPTGQAFFPDSDPGRVQVKLEAPIGTNIEASNQIAKRAQNRIQSLLQKNTEAKANVKNELVNVGIGGDAMFGGGSNPSNMSQITLNMVDFAKREESSAKTLRRLRDQFSSFPGVETEFTKSEQGPPTGPPVNIEVSGESFDKIVGITREIKDRMREGVEAGKLPGLVDVQDNLNTGRPELAVDVNRERAAQFGLSTGQIARTVRAAVNGIEASKYRTGDEEYDIRVRLQKADRKNLESLESLTIQVPPEGGGEPVQVPLVSVADLKVGSGFGSITHIDRERVVTVEGDAAPGYNGPEVLQNVQTYLKDYRQSLPSGYTMEYTGGNEDQQESFGFLRTALAVGVALIFIVLIAQFNSVSAPFIIVVAVGLSLIGVLLGLILTRTPFSLFTFIGIISLAGIVVNNNIVLIDYVMQLRQRGLDKQEAIIEGGATRLRPVLLTALTTVLGLVPLTFGLNVDFVGLLAELEPNFQMGSENTQFWGPMGTAIISGLTFATFLTLVIVPVMYSTFDSLSLRAASLAGYDSSAGAMVTDAVGGDGLAEKAPTKAAPDEVSGNGHAGGNGAATAGETDSLGEERGQL
jgi:multidrug efflux pump subunit AcrB